MRPQRVIVVTGTGTEIGKTYVAAQIAHSLREQGHSVIARKPAQSYEPGASSTDAHVLGDATGESPETVCPPHRWYPMALAPPMAAEALGMDPFNTRDLVAEVTASWTGVEVCLVETAGGMWSPQASDGSHAGDLAAQLRADAVLIVTDPSLGVINRTRGAAAALDPSVRVVVLLNRFDSVDGVHAENLAWLVRHDQFTVVTSPAEAATILLGL
jgi:dethiobiotin synthetase